LQSVQQWNKQIRSCGIVTWPSILRVNGPLVTKHMGVFGAKLGSALHFEATGSAVPLNGGVQSRWFT
jgi:hypothetical protein